MRKAAPGIHPLVCVDRDARLPLYRQIYEGYRQAILEQRLRAGQRLPSTRALAAELGVSRIPVLAAFEQLLAEGYFESRVGAGTFVAQSLPDELQRVEAGRPGGLAQTRARQRRPPHAGAWPPRRRPQPWLRLSGPFRTGQTALEHFPFHTWSALITRYSRNPPRTMLQYGDPMGHLPFREAISAYLRTARAVRCEADQVMVVGGSQHALLLAARALLRPASRVWIEDPGYEGARDVLAMSGARLVPVPVDAEGLDVATGIARSPRARAAYVTPSHQYPLGATMSAARRLKLLEWAQRAGAWILEDDYDSEYRYESLPISALQGLDRGACVVYIGTFSKVLFPALRVGYLVIPRDQVQRFAAIRESMDIFPPPLYQAVLADFIGEGHFGRHLRRTRELYRTRRSALVEAIRREFDDRLEVVGDQAGIHLVVKLPSAWRDRDVAIRAAGIGLSVVPLSSSFLERPGRQGLLLGYGSAREEEIPDAVRRLRTLLR